MVTRHPMKRLVSGYNEKMIYLPEDPSIVPARQYIIDEYRKNQTENTEIGPFKNSPTLEEFARFVVDNSTKRYDAFHRNIHWRPQAYLCHPCLIHYDHVVRMENFSDDFKVILDKMNLTLKDLPHKNHSYARLKGAAQLKYLPSELIDKLYDHYADDFDIFGYEQDVDF